MKLIINLLLFLACPRAVLGQVISVETEPQCKTGTISEIIDWCRQDGRHCCEGQSACATILGTTTICNGSCNGIQACWQFGGERIEEGSCNGAGACQQMLTAWTRIVVGENSCNGKGACWNARTNAVAPNSCNNDRACAKAQARDLPILAGCNEEEECYQAELEYVPADPNTPANNECSTFEGLRVPAIDVEGTTIGATVSTNVLGLGFDTAGGAVWYSFRGTGETLRLTFECQGPNWNSLVRVVSVGPRYWCSEYDGFYVGSAGMCEDGVTLNVMPTDPWQQYMIIVEGHECGGSCPSGFVSNGDFRFSLEAV